MPDLNFQVGSAEALRHSVAPALIFKINVDTGNPSQSIHAIALRCQIRIEPGRRRYSDQQKQSLFELFGPPDQWSHTLHPMLWTHTSTIVPAFEGSTVADLPVSCTYDFNIAATKYFDALSDDGEIPLCLLFSGTIFYESETGALQTAPISWSKDANFRLPVRTWRDMMDLYYPNNAWLNLNKETFDRLRQFKLAAGHTTWEQAMEDLLQSAQEKTTA